MNTLEVEEKRFLEIANAEMLRRRNEHPVMHAVGAIEVVRKAFVKTCWTCREPTKNGPGMMDLCDRCHGEFKAKEQREEKAKREAHWEKICHQDYRSTCVERLLKEHPKASNAITRWNPHGHRGLVLHGPSRHGKTRAVYHLLGTLHQQGHRVNALPATQFAHEARDHAKALTVSAWIAPLKSVPYLFIDDLSQATWTERAAEAFYEIVEHRCSMRRPLLTTSQVVGKTLSDLFSTEKNPERGQAIVMRLREYCDCVAV